MSAGDGIFWAAVVVAAATVLVSALGLAIMVMADRMRR